MLRRERFAILPNPGAPRWSCSRCGQLLDRADPDTTVPGGGLIAGMAMSAACAPTLDPMPQVIFLLAFAAYVGQFLLFLDGIMRPTTSRARW